jgi:hypothetical protein
MKWIHVIACIALVAVVSSCNRQSQVPEVPAEAWKLFSAEEGFSMEYPTDWTIMENQSGARVFFISIPKNGFANNFNLMIQELGAGGVSTLEEFDASTATQVKAMSGGTAEFKHSKEKILGYPASRYDYKAHLQGQDLQFRQWVVVKSGHADLFSYVDQAASFQEDEDKAERILRSFRFDQPSGS